MEREIRERHGLSRENLEDLGAGAEFGSTYAAAGAPLWEEVTMTEDRGGLPKMEHLCLLALLEDTSPGALLDKVLIEKGQSLARGD